MRPILNIYQIYYGFVMYKLSRDILKISIKHLMVISAIATLLMANISMTTTMNANAFNFGSKIQDVNDGSIDTDSLFSCVGAAIQCINTNQDNNNVVANNTEETPILPPSGQLGTLIVIKEVQCESTTPPVSCEEIDSNFEPQDFIITVTGQNPNPSQFGGSSSGTEVTLEPGSYEVTEDITGVDGKIYTEDDNGNTISGIFVNVLDGQIILSEDCSGTIEAGETRTCTITNPIRLL